MERVPIIPECLMNSVYLQDTNYDTNYEESHSDEYYENIYRKQ